MLCLICVDEIFQGDELKCSSCNEFLHFTCAGYRESNFRKLSKATKSIWCCSNCKIKKTSNSIENSPPQPNKMNEISDETLKGVIDSVKFMSSQFDSFGKQLADLILSITDLKNENKNFKEENMRIKNELNTLSRRVNTLEQQSLECHMEIVGIPENKNEVITNIMEKINSKLGTEVIVKNISRIPSKFSDKPKKISVIFNSLDDKNRIIERVKKEKIVAKDLDVSWKVSPIYFNNQMTQANKTLFFRAKITAKQVGYKYVWFNNNKIFVKKNEDSKVIIIFDENCISKIV